MKEYLITVVFDNQERALLKTFGWSVQYAIDNMLALKSVVDIIDIEEVDTQYIWDFHGDFLELRRLREQVGDEDLIRQGLDNNITLH
jgi:hypothetical protein